VVVRDGQLGGVDLGRLAAQSREYARESLAGERPSDASALEQLVAEMYERVEATDLDVDSYIRD
jgi:hypothetical protein